MALERKILLVSSDPAVLAQLQVQKTLFKVCVVGAAEDVVRRVFDEMPNLIVADRDEVFYFHMGILF